MKTTQLKFWSICYLLAFMLFTGTIFAQSASNLTGVFEGTRMQYDSNKENIVKEFTYKFELVQTNNVVQGTSTIISEEGNYAEVGIRGIVIKDKFYFEEYKVLDQITAAGMQWCYKSGVLNIGESKGEITLSGATPSYMINYGIACTGGVSKLSAPKADEKEETLKSIEQEDLELKLNLKVFPNPSTDNANLSFEIKEDASIKIEILNLSGQSVLNTSTDHMSKGTYHKNFDISEFSNGMYIFNIQINDKTYTKEIVKY